MVSAIIGDGIVQRVRLTSVIVGSVRKTMKGSKMSNKERVWFVVFAVCFVAAMIGYVMWLDFGCPHAGQGVMTWAGKVCL